MDPLISFYLRSSDVGSSISTNYDKYYRKIRNVCSLENILFSLQSRLHSSNQKFACYIRIYHFANSSLRRKATFFQMLYMAKCVTWPKASLRPNSQKQGFPNFDFLRKKNQKSVCRSLLTIGTYNDFFY